MSGTIGTRLIEHGRRLFNAPKQAINFTKEPEADALLNDLAAHPHAFVLACVMDRQIKAEKAWIIPYRFQQELGGFSMEQLAKLTPERVKQIMSYPRPLHRFVERMSRGFHAAIQHISDDYAGDARRIWAGKPSSAEVVYRFLEFDGVGPKIATMAANILARDFKIPFADHFSIDISVDVHVRRVFTRLGLTGNDPSVEQVIYKARSLHPEFPGIMDQACWEIGRKWCKPKEPDLRCFECEMRDLCRTGSACL